MNSNNVATPKSKAPIISVIIPFYNRIDLLKTALRSVVEQSFRDIEILLINDGSRGADMEIEKLVHSDPRIRCFNQKNQGCSSARNRGVAEAKGEYVAFLDSDDVYLPQKLELQYAFMREKNSVFSHTCYQTIDIEGHLIRDVDTSAMNGKIFPDIIACCTIATPTVMVKRDALLAIQGPFTTEFNIGEDVCLWTELAYRHSVDCMPKVLSQVRIGESTAALNMSKQIVGLTNILSYMERHEAYGNNPAMFRLLSSLEYDWKHYRSEVAAQENEQKRKEIVDYIRYTMNEGFFHSVGFFPKVSVVIPVYNGADYMADAIDSALAQTYKNKEVIVINDGSNDDGQTDAIAKSYGDKIRYFAKPNGGVSSALNLGIAKMEGEYFSWLSHDDLYQEDKLEKELKMLAQIPDRTTLLAGGYDLCDQDLVLIAKVNINTQYTKEELSRPLFPLLRGGINGCAMLIHKSHFDRVGTFDERLPTTQDYDLWFRMMRGVNLVYYPENYVISRFHAHQTSKTIKVDHERACNDLWIRMMTDLTDQERCELSGDPCAFYHDMYGFLARNTTYYGAMRYAQTKELAAMSQAVFAHHDGYTMRRLAKAMNTNQRWLAQNILPLCQHKKGSSKKFAIICIPDAQPTCEIIAEAELLASDLARACDCLIAAAVPMNTQKCDGIRHICVNADTMMLLSGYLSADIEVFCVSSPNIPYQNLYDTCLGIKTVLWYDRRRADDEKNGDLFDIELDNAALGNASLLLFKDRLSADVCDCLYGNARLIDQVESIAELILAQPVRPDSPSKDQRYSPDAIRKMLKGVMANADTNARRKEPAPPSNAANAAPQPVLTVADFQADSYWKQQALNMENTLSWRITKPLRAVRTMMYKIRK